MFYFNIKHSLFSTHFSSSLQFFGIQFFASHLHPICTADLPNTFSAFPAKTFLLGDALVCETRTLVNVECPSKLTAKQHSSFHLYCTICVVNALQNHDYLITPLFRMTMKPSNKYIHFYFAANEFSFYFLLQQKCHPMVFTSCQACWDIAENFVNEK